ncbi:hypothetical protein N7456_005862 [Penicillium angulare]|uniref:Uncharacterized protein n=1 Tax=Penicillium angulare TaxID=116970 RepID=A0A9W9KKY5_9EURO|nr:hypothetical protein N7456_005862 [Penicillium angulare]
MSTSATDIITYIGVPLAVLGVVPILYTSFRVLWTQRLIRSILQQHPLSDSAVTRVSLMGGIVEVELPRCTITPLDRELDSSYWKLNEFQVPLKGGSWSIFHWNRLVTGKVLYRCQYKEELTLPQADIEFEELVAFLLDRGAVPDPHGWHMLKTAGLWTPPGTPLLRPPRGKPGVVLTVVSPDDSDGVLSLHVKWKSQWDLRNSTSLPPFWMRLNQPRAEEMRDESTSIDESVTKLKSDILDDDRDKTLSRQSTAVLDMTEELESESSSEKPLLTAIDNAKILATKSVSDSVRFKVDHDQVKRVFFEDDNIMTGEHRDLSQIDDESFGLWFACVACALSQDADGRLWNFAIPSHITSFTRQKSIPCGLMVVLDLLSEDKVPPWASPPPEFGETAIEFQQRAQQEVLDRRMESTMPPAQAAEARNIRMMRDNQRFHTNHMKRIQGQQEYQQRRLIEAIQSPRLDNKVIAEASLDYLRDKKIVPGDYTLLQTAQAILYLTILDGSQAKVDVVESVWRDAESASDVVDGE